MTSGGVVEPVSPQAPPAAGPVKSALRALLIIELLTEQPDGLTFADLSERLELPKSSTHALLRTMVARRHVEYDSGPRRYRLGIRLWEAGRSYERSFDLPRAAEPHMRAARDELDETVQLSILDGLENVYVAKVTAEQRLVLASEVGMRLPAYATGLGKVLLASLPDDELDRRLGRAALVRFTDATITEAERLRAELRRVRRDGFARDHGEYTEGVFCVAVPVRDHRGGTIAAMSVSIPEVRLARHSEERMIAVLTQHSDELSATLGYGGGDHRADRPSTVGTLAGP